MSQEQVAKLPKLNPLITLSRAPNKSDGTPSWTLHNPVSNEYFRIDWAEFECLARFSQYETINDLIAAVNEETTLSIDEDDVKSLIVFLNQHGLLTLSDQYVAFRPQAKKSIWSKMLHGYLFFTLPLVKPERFLKQTLPFVRPFLTRRFVLIMMCVLFAAVLVTLQRADEFFNTFTQLFSVTGAVMSLAVFAVLKVIHELAHAYTATKYGVRVPHMGVAFMVMYPVLYTETTGSWQLSSRSRRLHIGMAGILAELCIAGIALWIWNISPAGSVTQSLAFVSVAISLIGSLLVNLNPLMRFDGYYMFCDITGQDNLQNRSCAFARWRLRRILFSDDGEIPEHLPEQQKKLLTIFGFALLTYRFFLFSGIALLVYMVFPKPLGAFLMAVELLWFIGMPIWSELKIWWDRRGTYLKRNRAKITFSVFAALFIFMILPWQRTISVPAVIHAAEYAAIYPEVDSYIADIQIKDREKVRQGQVLARLNSHSLEKDLIKTRQELFALENYRRRLMADPEQARLLLNDIEIEIAITKQALDSLQKHKERLTIKAPFDGEIRDFNAEIHAGRFIKKDDLLFRVIKPDSFSVTAYIEEHNLGRVKIDDKAVFMPKYSAFAKIPLFIKGISETNAEYLLWPELSSIYGGPLPASVDSGDLPDEKQIKLVQGVFSIQMEAADNSGYLPENKEEFVQVGVVRIKAAPRSAFSGFVRSILALFIRESGLN